MKIQQSRVLSKGAPSVANAMLVAVAAHPLLTLSSTNALSAKACSKSNARKRGREKGEAKTAS